jgi:radical SAM protein with 4Fe4S-binding SPASM domain
MMNKDEFESAAKALVGHTEYLYFHLMGEPLLHPKLGRFLEIAGEWGFKVILTTNGTLLNQQQAVLLSSPALHKVNISLHAFEANDLSVPFESYLQDCFTFGKAAEGEKLVVYRLWNNGGADALNRQILDTMESYFPAPWSDNRQGKRIGERIFLEYGDKFDWPDLAAPEGTNRVFCYGLRDQIGILCDGTVVPCCLDHEGDIALGNLFADDMESILAKPRAQYIYEGFTQKQAAEELCRKCGYARRFK